MLYEIAHIIKNRFLFLWKVVEWGNATLFYLMHKKKLMEINSVLEQVSNVYRFRTTTEEDVKKLVDFFARQPEEAVEFFKPHGFDGKAIREVVKNKSFLTFVVLKDDVTVGYFFLRCFVNGKCFRGKIVHKDWQGRGIAKLMGMAMTKVSQHLDLCMFGSISPENYASMASAKASNDIKVHKILENGYYYIEFSPKKVDNQPNIGGGKS